MKNKLEEFVEYLEKGNNLLNLLVDKDNREWVDKKEILNKAQSLVAEEKAQNKGMPVGNGGKETGV